MGPCAKTVVTCTLTLDDGQVFIGRNDCHNPQPVCPRLPGEGYEKCRSVCDQPGHAELQALAAASTALTRNEKQIAGLAVLRGHTYFCQTCQHALFRAGIRWLSVQS